jgi:phospholipid/cholesterol/gamma-HCH transport system substrate-binding protein
MSRRTEIQVGITVLLALAVLLWGVTWLKELTLQRHVRVWLVRVPQTGGLGASDEVQVNGIRKGSVRSMRLIEDYVLVELALDSEIILTTESRVAIRNVGLMGEKVIAVDLTMGGTPYTARDTIPGIYELGMGEVMASLGGSVATVNDLTRELASVASALNKNGDFAATMKNLRVTSEQMQKAVAENRAALKATVDNFAATSQTAKNLTTGREAELRRALDHFSDAAEKLDRLAARADSLGAALQRVTNKVDRGDGTIGKLVNDDKLYAETRASVQSLKALIDDIRANPKKYLTVKVF